MFDPEQTILLSYKLLQSPWLFDALGASGDLCRDLVIYAALSKQREVELYLPGFCRVMGYERANLLRPCTPAQVEQIRKTGWKKELIPQFSNVLGLALVRLATHNFIFPDDTKQEGHEVIEGRKIVERIDVYKVQKSGTTIKFTLSQEILEQNRKHYQTIYPAEYLGLRTEGGAQRPGGHPDDPARRLYLRLIDKRQYWDYLISVGKVKPYTHQDNYQELVEAAGLRKVNPKTGKQYDPEKKIAYELKRLLKRVGALPSIGLVPRLEQSKKTGVYEVSWTRLPLAKPAKSSTVEAQPAAPAAAPVMTASRPTSRRPSTGKPGRKSKAAPAAPAAPVSVPVYKRPASQQREKLLAELEEKKNSLRWFERPDTVQSYQRRYPDEPHLHGQHMEQARQALREVQDKLTGLGSQMV